ncbi:MAG: hypothetical protein WBD46_08865 [Acidobacteriaceae bacterium]
MRRAVCLLLFSTMALAAGAAEERWRAAEGAGVDYIASDQYELLGATLRHREVAANGAATCGAAGVR